MALNGLITCPANSHRHCIAECSKESFGCPEHCWSIELCFEANREAAPCGQVDRVCWYDHHRSGDDCVLAVNALVLGLCLLHISIRDMICTMCKCGKQGRFRWCKIFRWQLCLPRRSFARMVDGVICKSSSFTA